MSEWRLYATHTGIPSTLCGVSRELTIILPYARLQCYHSAEQWVAPDVDAL